MPGGCLSNCAAITSAQIDHLRVLAQVRPPYQIVHRGTQSAVLVDTEGDAQPRLVHPAARHERDLRVALVEADHAARLLFIGRLPVGAAPGANLPLRWVPSEAADLDDR